MPDLLDSDWRIAAFAPVARDDDEGEVTPVAWEWTSTTTTTDREAARLLTALWGNPTAAPDPEPAPAPALPPPPRRRRRLVE